VHCEIDYFKEKPDWNQFFFIRFEGGIAHHVNALGNQRSHLSYESWLFTVSLREEFAADPL
jgi:hypothetical protein